MTPDRLGIVIGAAFGLVYVEVNARAIPSPGGALVQALGAIAFVGLLVALHRTRVTRPGGGMSRPRFGRGYLLVVVAEVAAIPAGSAVLNGPLDLPQAVLPWVSIVVGAHFLGLAKVWHEASLGRLGAGIAALGAVGVGLAAAGAAQVAIASTAGVGPGVLLLMGSWWAVARQSQAAGATGV
ncbi:MAG: hypothetical protein ACRDOO_28070 [Actinomadura sp.]